MPGREKKNLKFQQRMFMRYKKLKHMQDIYDLLLVSWSSSIGFCSTSCSPSVFMSDSKEGKKVRIRLWWRSQQCCQLIWCRWSAAQYLPPFQTPSSEGCMCLLMGFVCSEAPPKSVFYTLGITTVHIYNRITVNTCWMHEYRVCFQHGYTWHYIATQRKFVGTLLVLCYMHTYRRVSK